MQTSLSLYYWFLKWCLNDIFQSNCQDKHRECTFLQSTDTLKLNSSLCSILNVMFWQHCNFVWFRKWSCFGLTCFSLHKHTTHPHTLTTELWIFQQNINRRTRNSLYLHSLLFRFRHIKLLSEVKENMGLGKKKLNTFSNTKLLITCAPTLCTLLTLGYVHDFTLLC